MAKRSVKILLHHEISDSVDVEKNKSTRSGWAKFWYGLLNALASASYAVGLAIWNVITLPVTIYRTFFTRSPKKPRTKPVMAFVVLILVVAVPFFAFSLLSEGWKLGGNVLGTSDDALQDLSAAQDAIANQDFAKAQQDFTKALAKLESLQADLSKSSALIQAASNFAPASINSQNLLEAATLLTESGLTASKLLGQLNSLSFTAEGLSTSGDLTSEAAIKQLAEDSKTINEKLTRAASLLEPINTSLLPAEYQLALNETKALVMEVSSQTTQLQNMSELLSEMMLGSKKFLVLLQNNNELRATGGFMGTIAQGQIENGVISKLDIRTVYDPDGQILDWVKPPSPLQAVNSRLFLRDSNWFANFPESAERISVMYEKGGGETPDLIFAFTPELFLDFLEITGPVRLPTYGVTISKDNFMEQIQTSTSIAYNKDLNQPKQLLADLYPVLMQRLGELTKGQPLVFLGLLQQNLAEKNILIYSRDPVLQAKFASNRWSGEVTATSGDYLQLNSTNLNGSKTDRALIRHAELTTTIETDGTITNQLTYKVENPLPALDGLTNRSWLRIFVPEGSRLLGVSGFSNFQPKALPENVNYVISPAIAQWESNMYHDGAKQMFIGKESGKTFFANWLETPGGQSQTVTVTYQLPQKLAGDIAAYQLLWEKQSGMLGLAAKQNLLFPGRTLEWTNLSLSQDGSNAGVSKYYWQKTLTTDHYGGVVLTR
jgi:hypothetical protein